VQAHEVRMRDVGRPGFASQVAASARDSEQRRLALASHRRTRPRARAAALPCG
jgi:hypothetical protein